MYVLVACNIRHRARNFDQYRVWGTRSSSPVSAHAVKDVCKDPTRPEVLVRAMDLLDASLEHYLPGNVDADDTSIKQICQQEDVQLDHVLTPLVLLVTKLCRQNLECRKTFRNRILPPDLYVVSFGIQKVTNTAFQ